MKISEFKVKNYKGFWEPEVVKFEHGFNLIIGQNNSGKSALLKAVSTKTSGKPHRSTATLPSSTSTPPPYSQFELMIVISGSELRDAMLGMNLPLWVHVPRNEHPNSDVSRSLLENIFQLGEIEIVANASSPLGAGTNFQVTALPSAIYPNGGAAHNDFIFYRFAPSTDKSQFEHTDTQMSAGDTSTWTAVFNHFQNHIYHFEAERLNVGKGPAGYSGVLESNASNLPAVLSVLKAKNTARFKRFSTMIHTVFPTIYEVSSVPIQGDPGRLEIMVWSDDPESEREDLTIELSESGTGVGQVLAILYVVLTSATPRTIIIDEPNSFLHPSATRKLIEILKNEFPQHQYILSTHSPEIIRGADPSTLTMVRWQKPFSVIEQLDAKSILNIQDALLEVGTKLSDVFGADRILWVEGKTEEECIPVILSQLMNPPIFDTSVIGVTNTGDFESKKKTAENIWKIYERLSKTNALVPPAVAFLFDEDGKNSQTKADMERASKGLAYFIPRRMFENYLIETDAVSKVLFADTFKPTDIENWLAKNANDPAYFLEKKDIPQYPSDDWYKQVDGANLLKDMCDQLSDNKLPYQKTVHSVSLAKWIVTNKPHAFNELVTILEKIFKKDIKTE